MTTKPKAKKFRVKRGPSSPAAAPTPQATAAPAAAAANAPRPAAPPPQANPQRAHAQAAQPAKTGEVASPAQVSGETDIDAIRREGLTGRQLRMARRVAQKHNLAPTSDFDAVRLLRSRGIDPFQRSNMLELVVPQGENADAATGGAIAKQPGPGQVQLPQTIQTSRQTLPSEEVSPAERRMREISDIQRDITKRRRKKLTMLLTRLAFFVFFPTFCAGYYFYAMATPMYATNSQFLIIQNEGSGGASPLGGLLPTQFANSADSVATQGFLQSKNAMISLDAEQGFIQHFSDDNIDAIQRLDEDATTEEAYKLYKKNVKIGYDPTEGVVRMEVIAADPQVSQNFSESLLRFAENQVNGLSQQKREDGMQDAREAFETAQQNRRDVQEKLITLQVENGVDPEAVIASIRAQITNYEGLLIEKELELAALLDNARPNRAKVEGAQGDVRRITDQLARLNARMNNATVGENSLAKQAVTLQLAQADLASADMALQAAQTQMDQARTEASRQVRYLTIAESPVAPQEATYPRKFENTILAFLVFAGIYLMLSLTASILREQVTS